LALLLERSKFVSEKADTLNGAPARLLHFDMGLPPEVDDKQRQYIKSHVGTLAGGVAPGGTPLASRTHDDVNGRAFLFLKFQIGNDEDCTFGRIGDRLVGLTRESRAQR